MTILYTMPGQEGLAASLLANGGLEEGHMTLRRFPDGETYIRILDRVEGCDAAILCQLHHPDEQFLSLLLLASTLRDLGANRVGLVAPYLAYMRQDKRFSPGEGISAHYFARLLSQHIDWLLCVDPHLHRIHDLREVYSIPALAMTAVEPIAQWIRGNVPRPLIIGPDEESRQWAASVADAVGCGHEILVKTRHGDRDVEVSLPSVSADSGHTPVLVDDIISTGKTMLQTAMHLQRAGFPSPVCVAVHGLFSPGALEEMQAAGLRVMCCNSIPGAGEQIDLSPVLIEGLRQLLNP